MKRILNVFRAKKNLFGPTLSTTWPLTLDTNNDGLIIVATSYLTRSLTLVRLFSRLICSRRVDEFFFSN